MLAIAFTLVAVAAAAALAWRRYARRSPSIARRLDPVRPGVKHFATTVCDLSDRGLHLPARGAHAKPRLGALLDLRHP